MTLQNSDDLRDEFDAIERWEPHVHALVDVDLAAARQRLAACSAGPLAGWSIGVKDIIDVAGMATRCNAAFMPPTPVDKNASVVDRLLHAGGFVMAKTVTTSFAYFDPGPTTNPWNRDHTPGGSSSGSAAAVACGMVRLALGTQTVASINRPASFCGVVGFKPSYALLPVDGVFPFSPSVDTVGLFTRDVADTQSAITALVPELKVAPPEPVRIALVNDLYTDAADPEMLAALRGACRALAAAGCEIGEVCLPGECAAAYEHHIALISAEAASVHRSLFRDHREHYSPMLRELVLRGGEITTDQVERVQTHRQRLRDQIETSFGNADFFLVPAAPGVAPVGLERTGDPRFSLLWTYSGCPSLTLPVTLSSAGLPLGLQLVGRPGEDAKFLAAARQIEAILGFRVRPTLER